MRRKGIVLLTGPIGTGKTTVVHTALQILMEKAASSKPISSAFILNPTLSREEFLEMLLSEFEIPCTATSKPARLAALQRMLLETQRKGGTSLLLVDEAHLLTPELLEEIRLLSNSDTYKEKLLQIVLCGQPELMDLLRRPEMRALKQRVSSTCSLRPLTVPEVSTYIAERLRSAGFRGTVCPFPPDVIERIVKLTEGTPRLVNLLCDACLTGGLRATRAIIDLAIVNRAAEELGLDEIPAAQDWAATDLLGRPSGAGHDFAGDAVIVSVLDVLVQAMKRRSSSAPSANGVRAEANIKEQVKASVTTAQERDPAGSKAIQSAVDVLIQTMKVRPSHSMELSK